MTAQLPTVQQDFQNFILGHLGADKVLLHIADKPGLTSGERLSIYHNGYRIRLHEALLEAFEKTHRYLGDTMFYAACSGYIDKYPSSKRSLRWYGDQFANFLRTQVSEYPVVAELAAFEWALGLAFDAADQAVLTLEKCREFSAGDWETISFDCQDSVQFLPMHCNGVAIWLALTQEQAPPATQNTAEAVTWLIWRRNQQSHFRSLSREEHQALSGMQAGLSFSEVCAIAASNNPEATAQIAAWLHTWIAEEVLRG